MAKKRLIPITRIVSNTVRTCVTTLLLNSYGEKVVRRERKM